MTLGWMTDDEANNVLCSIQKLDPQVIKKARATCTMVNNKQVSKYLFEFVIDMDCEKELFFKLKLKYGHFQLHPTAVHAMLVAYGPA